MYLHMHTGILRQLLPTAQPPADTRKANGSKDQRKGNGEVWNDHSLTIARRADK